MSETVFELERTTDRAEIAALLGAFADALGDDRSAVFAAGEGAFAVEVPEPAHLTVDLERADEPPTVELEFELEWDEGPDESTVRSVDADDRTPIVDDDAPSAAEADATAATEADATAATEADAAAGEEADAASGDDGADSTGDDEATTPKPASGVVPPDAASGSGASEPDAPAGDAEDAGDRQSRFEIYRDRAGEWRWRLVHWNGNVIADGGEGYASRHNAERGLRSVVRNAPGADVEYRE